MTTTLTTTQIEDIESLVSDIDDAELRSYSGRNMYGKQCLGIDMESMTDAFVSLSAFRTQTWLTYSVTQFLTTWAGALLFTSPMWKPPKALTTTRMTTRTNLLALLNKSKQTLDTNKDKG